ncbi:phage virion morphogenesis protein [Candidatus Aalborgicola defluviihabitans]|uniref:phage virion morphogenesis protein n=1 Tax=Candidatus Aalborgicola defluviihabitans TaxID=3386187 RepID=UPI0039B8DD7E
MITIQVTDKAVLDMLGELSRRMTNLQPAMKEIGEDIVDSTKRRFADGVDPDGNEWKANSTETTIPFYLGAFGGSHKKDGSLSKAGAARSAAKKPLTGETKSLRTYINYQLDGNSGVRIGSPMVYAAMQQFGGTTSPNSMIPGKTIPARPFLGLSDADTSNILDIVRSYLVG